MTSEEIAKVEDLVNDAILAGYTVSTEELPIEDAKQRGAMALFGEKYGDTVRVVDMGGYSVEFCGGTHLANTAMAGPFRIRAEFSVASGVRRIEATTGKETLKFMHNNNNLINRAAATLKAKPEELHSKIEQKLEEMREMRQALDKFKAQAMAGDVERFLFASKKVAGLQIITATLQDQSADALRKMGDMLRDRDENSVAVFATFSGEKITFHASCGKRAVARGIKAGDLIKQVTAITGGSGGGKPESAMGGGKDILKIDDALATIDDYVAKHAKEEA
jgi:alanyl-tRNA synthetase